MSELVKFEKRLKALASFERCHLVGVPIYTATYTHILTEPRFDAHFNVIGHTPIPFESARPLFFIRFDDNSPVFESLGPGYKFTMHLKDRQWTIANSHTTWTLPASSTHGMWIHEPVELSNGEGDAKETLRLEFSREFITWYNSTTTYMNLVVPRRLEPEAVRDGRTMITAYNRAVQFQGSGLPSRIPSEIFIVIVCMMSAQFTIEKRALEGGEVLNVSVRSQNDSTASFILQDLHDDSDGSELPPFSFGRDLDLSAASEGPVLAPRVVTFPDSSLDDTDGGAPGPPLASSTPSKATQLRFVSRHHTSAVPIAEFARFKVENPW